MRSGSTKTSHDGASQACSRGGGGSGGSGSRGSGIRCSCCYRVSRKKTTIGSLQGDGRVLNGDAPGECRAVGESRVEIGEESWVGRECQLRVVVAVVDGGTTVFAVTVGAGSLATVCTGWDLVLLDGFCLGDLKATYGVVEVEPVD